jgi:hypothetical protein
MNIFEFSFRSLTFFLPPPTSLKPLNKLATPCSILYPKILPLGHSYKVHHLLQIIQLSTQLGSCWGRPCRRVGGGWGRMLWAVIWCFRLYIK